MSRHYSRGLVWMPRHIKGNRTARPVLSLSPGSALLFMRPRAGCVAWRRVAGVQVRARRDANCRVCSWEKKKKFTGEKSADGRKRDTDFSRELESAGKQGGKAREGCHVLHTWAPEKRREEEEEEEEEEVEERRGGWWGENQFHYTLITTYSSGRHLCTDPEPAELSVPVCVCVCVCVCVGGVY